MLQALADLIGHSGSVVASTVGNRATVAFSKSVSDADLKLGPDATEQQSTLAQARARYFDALITSRSTVPADAGPDAPTQLRVRQTPIQRCTPIARPGGTAVKTRFGLIRLPPQTVLCLPLQASGEDPSGQSAPVVSGNDIAKALKAGGPAASRTRGLSRRPDTPAATPSMQSQYSIQI